MIQVHRFVVFASECPMFSNGPTTHSRSVDPPYLDNLFLFIWLHSVLPVNPGRFLFLEWRLPFMVYFCCSDRNLVPQTSQSQQINKTKCDLLAPGKFFVKQQPHKLKYCTNRGLCFVYGVFFRHWTFCRVFYSHCIYIFGGIAYKAIGVILIMYRIQNKDRSIYFYQNIDGNSRRTIKRF